MTRDHSDPLIRFRNDTWVKMKLLVGFHHQPSFLSPHRSSCMDQLLSLTQYHVSRTQAFCCFFVFFLIAICSIFLSSPSSAVSLRSEVDSLEPGAGCSSCCRIYTTRRRELQMWRFIRASTVLAAYQGKLFSIFFYFSMQHVLHETAEKTWTSKHICWNLGISRYANALRSVRNRIRVQGVLLFYTRNKCNWFKMKCLIPQTFISSCNLTYSCSHLQTAPSYFLKLNLWCALNHRNRRKV